MINPETHQNNKNTILYALKSNGNSLVFLDLKKKSKLPNLYFFKALEDLEKEKLVYRFNENNDTWIKITG